MYLPGNDEIRTFLFNNMLIQILVRKTGTIFSQPPCVHGYQPQQADNYNVNNAGSD